MAALNPTAKALADGQLGAAKATIYTAPATAGTKIVIPIGGLVLVNTGAAARTVNLYTNRAGTSRRFVAKDYTLQAGNDGFLRNDAIIVLESSDLIEGDASTAAEVDYTISGYEEIAV